MEVMPNSSLILLPPAWRIPSADWQRVAVRKSSRDDLVDTRRIVDGCQEDRPSPALKRLSKSPVPFVLRFINACPDLTYALLAEHVNGCRVRCSQDLSAVRELVREALDRRHGRPAVDLPPAESRRVARRREQAYFAMSLLVERLTQRDDLSLVIAWRVTGDSSANLDSSHDMEPQNCQRRLVWLAQNVLNLQIDCPSESLSPMEWGEQTS